MAQRRIDCAGCDWRLPASTVLPGDLCTWSATPAILKGEATGACSCSEVEPLKTGGVVKGGDWLRNAVNLVELHALAFRGVNLVQVCLRCEGTGIEPDAESSTPSWIAACHDCHGRGFEGDRDPIQVIAYEQKPLRPPKKFEQVQAKLHESIEAQQSIETAS